MELYACRYRIHLQPVPTTAGPRPRGLQMPMATRFSRTLRSLENDRSTAELALLASAILLAVVWLIWFSLVRLPVVASSEDARVESASGALTIEPSVSGAILSHALELGRRAEKGETLLVLDSREEQLQLEASRERLVHLEARLEQFQAEIEALELSASLGARRDLHAFRRGEHELVAQRAAASASIDEEERLGKLQAAGLASDLELFKAQAESTRANALVASKAEELQLQSAAAEFQEADRLASLRRAQGELLLVMSQVEDESWRIAELRESIARKSVPAPISGVISDVASLGPGTIVTVGEVLGTMVADSTSIGVVAWFEPEVDFGPLRSGQPARVWLDSMPRGFGQPLAGEVAAVSSEIHLGKRRVEVRILTEAELIHGQAATVEVEVARIPAARLALQKLARRSQRVTDPRSSEPSGKGTGDEVLPAR